MPSMVTQVPSGILRGVEALRAIQEGSISGGMIPKVEASLKALHRGVGEIVIGEYGGTGSLKLLLSGKLGTIIKLN